jgi:DNA modification methylase
MPSLREENRRIDLVATDPHYGVFKDNRDRLDLRYIPLSYDLLKEHGAIFSFASQKRLLDFLQAFAKTDFKWQNTIVWFYRNGFSRESRKFAIKYDPILFYTKGDFAINTDAVRVPYISTERLKYDCNNAKMKGWRPNPLGAKLGDVWECPAITSPATTKEKEAHEWQKPIKLMKTMILAASQEGETVLDMFLGSGTTIVAAMQTKRKCIGIEIEEKYCEMSAKRVQKETRQMENLFS